MMPDGLTGAMVAEFDQAWAESAEFLDTLVSRYLGARQLDIADGIPECVSVVSLSQALMENLTVDPLVSALVVAIVTRARRIEAGDG